MPDFHGGNGSYVGLDFDPGPLGTVGQVINFGIDDEDKCVLAPSLDGSLQICIAKLAADERITFFDEPSIYSNDDIYFPQTIAREIRRRG